MTRQYMIQIFYKIIFFKYISTNVDSMSDHFSQALVSNKFINLLICFCSFDLSCPILEKDKKNGMFVSYIVLLNSVVGFFNFVCFDLV